MFAKCYVFIAVLLGITCGPDHLAGAPSVPQGVSPQPPFLCDWDSLQLPPKPVWIVTASSLRLRREPKVSSEAIASLPFGSKVVEIKRTPHLERLDSRIAPWVYIEWTSASGWIFGGYLSLWHKSDSTALARLAESAYKKDPAVAAELYAMIKANPLDRNRDMMTSCKLLADERLALLQCVQSGRRRLFAASPQALFSQFQAAFERRQTRTLLAYATCGFGLARCRSDIGFAQAPEVAMDRVNGVAGPILTSSIRKVASGTAAQYEFRMKDSSTTSSVLFVKTAEGWAWSSFCTSAESFLK